MTPEIILGVGTLRGDQSYWLDLMDHGSEGIAVMLNDAAFPAPGRLVPDASKLQMEGGRTTDSLGRASRTTQP